MEEKKTSFYRIGGLVFLLACLYLLVVFPASGDDFNRLKPWSQGIDEVWQDFAPTYNELNGRIGGNFLSFFAILKPIRVVFKFLSFIGIGYLLYKIFNRKSSVIFYAFTLFYLPIRVFREVVVWNAGFFNYIPPILLILITFYVLQKEVATKVEGILIFFTSLLSCLFVENLSIYAFLMPILVFIIYRSKDKIKYLFALAGALLGNIIMFSSPVYWEISQKSDSYRTFGFSDLSTTINNNWYVFSDNLIPFALAMVFIVILIYLIYKNPKENANYSALIFLFAIIIEKELSISNWLSIALHIGFYLSLIFVLRGMEYASHGIFACISMALVMGPLLVVSPIGSRNFFTSAIFNLFILLSLLYSLDLSIDKKTLVTRIIILATVIKLIVFLFAYSVNYGAYKEMLEIIEEATINEKEEVVLDPYPYEELVHPDDGKKVANMYSFKYGKDDLVEIKIK